MLKLVAWLAFTLIVIAGLWQLAADEPYLASWATGLVLLASGLVAGIRIGYDAASRFMLDVMRANRHLGDQHKELTELNREILSRLSPTPSSQEETTHVD